MKLNSGKTLLVVVTLLPSGGVHAADPTNGATLHAGNCVACHASLTGGKPDTLYTRPDRRVTSLARLQKQVRFCEQQLELTWFDEEVSDVVEYLNVEFYKF